VGNTATKLLIALAERAHEAETDATVARLTWRRRKLPPGIEADKRKLLQ